MSAIHSSVEESASRDVPITGHNLTISTADEERPPKESMVQVLLEDEGQRKKFRHNYEAVCAIVVQALNLPSVWRFPFICYKSGGGAFFIAYLLMLILVANSPCPF